ncbi:MAG: hypothetical protein ACPGMX_04165 [Paracoccaceae bacterium]
MKITHWSTQIHGAIKIQINIFTDQKFTSRLTATFANSLGIRRGQGGFKGKIRTTAILPQYRRDTDVPFWAEAHLLAPWCQLSKIPVLTP